MNKSEIEQLSAGPDLAGIRARLDECQDLANHAGFQAFEKLLFNYLDSLYNAIVVGGIGESKADFLRGQIYAIRFLLGLPKMNIDTAETFVQRPVTPPQEDIAEIDTFISRRYNKDTGE